MMTVALVAIWATGSPASADSTSTTKATVKGAGISLQYPSTWTVVPVTKQGAAALAKAAAKKNPKLAALLTDIDVSKFKFYAIDGDAVAGARSNVNVLLAGGAQGVTTAEVRDQLGQAYQAAGATLVDVKQVKVSGKTAFRVDVTIPIKVPDGTVTSTSEGQLLIPGAKSSATITVTSSDDASGAALIDAVLASVHRI